MKEKISEIKSREGLLRELGELIEGATPAAVKSRLRRMALAELRHQGEEISRVRAKLDDENIPAGLQLSEGLRTEAMEAEGNLRRLETEIDSLFSQG